jgi:DNA-binding IclR family transcriptional regulator
VHVARNVIEGRPLAHPSVVSKVVAMLEAFRPAHKELSLNQLAGRSGLAISTAYRHATELVELGLLETGERGGYRIGLRLWEIASLAERGLSLREVAQPYMLDLYEATHENVHLAVLDGYEALYVEKTTGRMSAPVKTREARRLPLHATGVGKTLLAYAPEEFVLEVIARGLHSYTPRTIVTSASLLRALGEIRRRGYGWSNEELTLATVAVAAPVRDRNGDVVAALSIAGRSTRIDVAKLAPAVKTAALGITRRYSSGGRPEGRR